MMMGSSSSSRVSEIEEDEWCRSEELFEIRHLDSITEETGKEDEEVVYVALLGQVTNCTHDMDALVWTLNHLLHPFSEIVVNLIHVFPQLHYIPSPCKSYALNSIYL